LKSFGAYDIVKQKEAIDMGKNNKKKNQKKSGQWTPPKGSSSFFYPASDYEFKEAHPVGYGFLVMLGIAALLLPVIL